MAGLSRPGLLRPPAPDRGERRHRGPDLRRYGRRARAGLYENRPHTSNGRDWLLAKTPGYAGAESYVDSQRAVTGGRVVTASGLAPFTFASAIARLAVPEAAHQLAEYDALYAAEWSQPA